MLMLYTELHLTYPDVLSLLLHILLDTEYNTPAVFPLARYSTMLRDLVRWVPSSYSSDIADRSSALTVELINYLLAVIADPVGVCIARPPQSISVSPIGSDLYAFAQYTWALQLLPGLPTRSATFLTAAIQP